MIGESSVLDFYVIQVQSQTNRDEKTSTLAEKETQQKRR